MGFFEMDTLIPYWKDYKHSLLGEQFDPLNLQPFKSLYPQPTNPTLNAYPKESIRYIVRDISKSMFIKELSMVAQILK